MLTSDDLKKLKSLLREEIENEVSTARDDIKSDITMSKIRIQGDIRELKDRIKSLEIRTTKNHAEVRKEIREVLNFLDKQDVVIQKRAKKVEDHLNLPNN